MFVGNSSFSDQLRDERNDDHEANMNATTGEDSERETLEEDNGESSKSSISRHSSFSDQLRDERSDNQEENASVKNKKLDVDEVIRYAQYIPKKGFFYEHDDRTMADENEESNGNDPNRWEIQEKRKKDSKNPAIKKGKLWIEKNDRWSHDRYNDEDQKPKTTQELIETYGYDIRNEEPPPKAGWRRRYGRGPNKYTRNWEDEEANARSAPQPRRVFHNNRKEFSVLGKNNGGHKSIESNQGRSTSPPQQTQRVSQQQKFQQPPGERERVPRREWQRTREEKSVEREKEKTKPSPVKDILPPAFEKPVEIKSLPATINLPSPPIIQSHERKEKEVETPKVVRGRGFRNTGKQRPSMELYVPKGRGPLPAAFSREISNTQVLDSWKHAEDVLVQDFSHNYIGKSKTNNTNSNLSNIVEETIIPGSERRSHGHNNCQPSETSAGGVTKRY